MRSISLLLSLLLPAMSWAQELPPTALSGAPSPPKRSVAAEPLLDAFDFQAIRHKDLDHENWRVAVDFGLPNGVRVQRRIFDTNFWLEGGVGAWWIVPYASACIRYDWAFIQRQ